VKGTTDNALSKQIMMQFGQVVCVGVSSFSVDFVDNPSNKYFPVFSRRTRFLLVKIWTIAICHFGLVAKVADTAGAEWALVRLKCVFFQATLTHSCLQ
jgi:hypothetical protein